MPIRRASLSLEIVVIDETACGCALAEGELDAMLGHVAS
jgi:hypothetical protein